MGSRSVTERGQRIGRGLAAKGCKKTFRVMEMFYILILVVIQLCRISKIHQTVQLK